MKPSALALLLAALAAPLCAQSGEKLHFSYHWHMEQPIYWPDQQLGGADRYERVWESLQRKDGGALHPENDLRDIFSKPDRVAAYQWRVPDSLNLLRGYAEAGAQVSFSGGLIENLQSLGGAFQLGYSPTWHSWYREARGWRTSGAAQPRCELVIFPFHHPLLPLLDDAAVRMELKLYQEVYGDAWGSGAPRSRGFFPPEMAFSTRLIPALTEHGVSWCLVSGEKLSRACPDFPVVLGSGGVNCDPPNPADQLNAAQGHYWRRSISRGCAPAEAYPFAFTPHRTGYVDPDTGGVSSLIVVPCSQSLGWEDGYSPLGIDGFHALQARNDPLRPMLVMLAHDGDNNWGGGYDYYLSAVPNFVSQAQAAGYLPTVVEEYLADHPVPADDFVHVEDGAWVNADGDFGAPQFLNWNWPPVDAAGRIDVAGGWAEDVRNWAVITAAQNAVSSAEQRWRDGGGSVDPRQVLYPGAASNPAERAWHYFLGALNSGFLYYGTALDLEVKPAVACNEAWEHASAVPGGADRTPPTVWIPQRQPWNPGAVNFGPQYGHQQVPAGGDFWVWTFAHDLSGVPSVDLYFRLDLDGQNPLASAHNETYAGGPEVGPWQTLAMTRRAFPAGNVYGNPSINFFEMPVAIADQYFVQVTGLKGVLVDYYVQAVDGHGNVERSPIQHVWVGSGSGGGQRVVIQPNPAVAGQGAGVYYEPSGGPLAGATAVYLHYGFNDWNPVNPSDPLMTWNGALARWEVTVPVAASAWQLDLAFRDGSGNWDNNGGQDWHFPVVPGAPPPAWNLDGQLDGGALLLGSNGGRNLWAGLKGSSLYLATEPAGSGQDRFLLVARAPGALQNAMWAKAGQVARWDAYLAQEADNGWSGWFDHNGGAQQAAGAVLEGTLNLTQEFGALPAAVYLAAASYATPNGGALDPARQIPPSLDGDGDLEAAEYLRVDLSSFPPSGWPNVKTR